MNQKELLEFHLKKKIGAPEFRDIVTDAANSLIANCKNVARTMKD